jgi:thiol-disulfide isomerase/thioredoxin
MRQGGILGRSVAEDFMLSWKRLRRFGMHAAGALVLLAASPGHGEAAVALHDMGPAPAFTGIDGWLNSPPLTMAALRGKVVLVDFWAYSCINCLRTLPSLIRWQHDFAASGLVVVGVHTPEFKFEHDAHNVQAAIDRFHINYPVAQDNEVQTWKAFGNQYWPTQYLIDRNGRIVYKHEGEGDDDVTEAAIRSLLDAKPTTPAPPAADLSHIGSPEMYFGLDRVEDLASPQDAAPGVQTYTAPASLKLNEFALAGAWDLSPEKATLAQDGGEITLHCRSGKVFMVASSAAPVTLSITVDGKHQPDVTVQESRLYTLFDSNDYREHMVTIKVPKAGFAAYTFTFG